MLVVSKVKFDFNKNVIFKVSIAHESQNDGQDLNESQEDGHKDINNSWEANDKNKATEDINKKSKFKKKHPKNVSLRVSYRIRKDVICL